MADRLMATTQIRKTRPTDHDVVGEALPGQAVAPQAASSQGQTRETLAGLGTLGPASGARLPGANRTGLWAMVAAVAFAALLVAVALVVF
jgi:hypothetical protein